MHKISRARDNQGAVSQGQPLLSDSWPGFYTDQPAHGPMVVTGVERFFLQTFFPRGVFSSSAQAALIVNVEDHGACGCTQSSTEFSIQATSAEHG